MVKIVIITLLAIAVVGLGATALYVTQRQEGDAVGRQGEVATGPGRFMIWSAIPMVLLEKYLKFIK
jgi:hypothetical protein